MTPERLKALKTAMQRQQRQTQADGLPAERIDAEALLILQRFICKCGCGKPLDLESDWNPQSTPPGYPVVAHEFFRAGKKSPGHTLGNVWWWRWECNRREAGPETVAAAKGKRFEVRKPEPVAEAEPPSRKMGKAVWRPANYVSPLSKSSPGYRRPEWKKRTT
jgi:hypothetical protein